MFSEGDEDREEAVQGAKEKEKEKKMLAILITC